MKVNIEEIIIRIADDKDSSIISVLESLPCSVLRDDKFWLKLFKSLKELPPRDIFSFDKVRYEIALIVYDSISLMDIDWGYQDEKYVIVFCIAILSLVGCTADDREAIDNFREKAGMVIDTFKTLAENKEMLVNEAEEVLKELEGLEKGSFEYKKFQDKLKDIQNKLEYIQREIDKKQEN